MYKLPYEWIFSTLTVKEREAGKLTFMLPAEAAAYLGISRQTLMRHLWDGNIPHVRIGRHYRFIKEELDRWRLNAGRNGQ